MIAVIPRAKPEGPLRPQQRSLATLGMTGLLFRAMALVALAVGLFAAFSPTHAETPDAALAGLLKAARAKLPAACSQPNVDRLIKILCAKKIRIGIRDYYPLFAERKGDKREGYEVDVALAIGRMLGVDVDFVRVNAATRIPLLAEDRIDLAIATMGHNTQRDGQVRFIRPHYYRSETTVVGPRELPVASMLDLPGRTVCVTVGNGSNAELVSQGARLMLFDEAGVLPDRLKDQTCTLAAQDDSFFAKYFTDEDFNSRYFQKFGFAQVPWGMAVARQGSAELARALDLISQVFHRDGLFIDIGRLHSIRLGFLQQQQQVWRKPECNTDAGSANPSCVLPPLNTALQPTSFAADVTSFENWVEDRTGIDLALPMLATAPAWSLFKDGVFYSLVLIAGALAATLVFALVLGAAMGSRSFLLRWPARLVTMALQSSPIVLTLVIAATIAHGLFALSTVTVLGAAIAALGLANGSNAGQAIGEAMWSLRAEGMQGGLFGRALSRAATQIVAFLINAAKGTPIASFVGAPELLSSLTDITSFSSGRITTYSILLIFYTAVVLVVVWLCGKLKADPRASPGRSMSGPMDLLSGDFLPKFLAGMVINFEIAAIALVIGLALGLLLAAGRLTGGAVKMITVSIISLMRAAPTFVVMFFLLNAIPRDATLFGVPFALSGVMTVALSLVPYSAAYVADAGVDSMQHLRAGATHGAFLFFPNITRAFFVMVMSSSAGAAIGVTEGITVILRQAEQLSDFNDRLVLFAIGIVLFGIPLQAGFMVMSLFQRRFGRSTVEEEASA